MRAILKILGIFVLCAVAYLTLWPVPIDPVKWQAPKAIGFQGDFSENDKLDDFDALTMSDLHGPEAAAVFTLRLTRVGWFGGCQTILSPSLG